MSPTTIIFIVASLIACESEIDNKPAASVGEAVPVAAPAAAEAPTGDAQSAAPPQGETKALALQGSSQLEWIGAKITKDHPGGFKGLSGEATVDEGALQSARLVIDTTTLYSDHPKLTKHLLSDDFFHVEQHPTATFDITKVETNKTGSHTLTGTLELLGTKKEISFPATVTVSETGVSVNAEFTLLRKDFGMTYPGKPDDLIRDEVLIKGTLNFGA